MLNEEKQGAALQDGGGGMAAMQCVPVQSPGELQFATITPRDASGVEKPFHCSDSHVHVDSGLIGLLDIALEFQATQLPPC